MMLTIFKKISKNQNAFALMIVLGTITILTALLIEFTFNTQVNKTIAQKKQDRVQARLNAESGLHLAMARIQIYKEVLNQMKKMPQLKAMIPEKEISHLYADPFIYPVPIQTKHIDLLSKTILQDLDKNLLIQGSINVEVKNISELLNVNLLRATKDTNSKDEDNKKSSSNPPPPPDGTDDSTSSIQDKFVELLTLKLKEKRETDPEYDLNYGNEPADLQIKRIKFYISDENSYDGAEKNQISGEYRDQEPKMAPLNSLSELYLIPQIPPAIIDLIIPSLTVHGEKNIDLNQINSDQLKWLVADIDDKAIKDFFRAKNSKTRPKFFSNKDDFIKLIADELRLVDEAALKKRFEEFEKNGFSFEGMGSLLQIVSQGSYGDANYQITATIDIPLEPAPGPDYRGIDPSTGKCPDGFDLENNPQEASKACKEKQQLDPQGKPVKKVRSYLTPKIVEIQVE